MLTQVQTSQTFSLSGVNSLYEQWRSENGQRYCLATIAKDTDCPGWRDEMTFLWKQEQHNLNEFCWVERGTFHTCLAMNRRRANTQSEITAKEKREISKEMELTVNERCPE